MDDRRLTIASSADRSMSAVYRHMLKLLQEAQVIRPEIANVLNAVP